MATVPASPPPAPRAHPRMWKIIDRKPLTAGRAARIIGLATIAVTIAGGVVIHFADPKNYPDVGVGLALQTVTTVGYGDVVPTNTLGRVVASVVMLTGIGFLTVITATITSTFVESARRRVEGDNTDVVVATLDQISERLEVIESGLKGSGS